MGLLDKLFGHRDSAQSQQSPSPGRTALSADEQAIGRYRYMLQTAPPHTLEQAHAEAFAKLTSDQRTLLLQRLSAELPEAERSAAHGTLRDDPQSLARLATRSEIRQPGTLERSFGGMSGRGGAMGGMGGTLAGSFLASMAGVVIGSAIAQSFLSDTDVAAADTAADGTSADADADLADASDGGADDFDMGGFDEV